MSKEDKVAEVVEANRREEVGGAVKYTLLVPVEFDGETIEAITIKRPRGKHIKKMGQDMKMGDLLAIASKVSGVSGAVFEEMDAADCIAVAEIMGDFFESGQRIGKR